MSRYAPPFDSGFGQLCLREVMREQLRLGCSNGSKLIAQNLTLTGMNAPIGHAVQVIHQTAPVVQQTSTEEIAATLDELMIGHDKG